MRLILFDIDGTLIHAHGVGHRSFVRAMQSVFGTTGPHDTYDWRGKTDPWILRDLMRLAGIPEEVLDARLTECFHQYIAVGGVGADFQLEGKIPCQMFIDTEQAACRD